MRQTNAKPFAVALAFTLPLIAWCRGDSAYDIFRDHQLHRTDFVSFNGVGHKGSAPSLRPNASQI